MKHSISNDSKAKRLENYAKVIKYSTIQLPSLGRIGNNIS